MTKKPVRPGGSMEIHYESILGDISNIIDWARRSAARSVNCIMTAAYWFVGRRIVELEQRGKVRAQYGASILERLSSDLTIRYGKGFGVDNLQRFRAFYLAYSAERIYATVSSKLTKEGQTENYEAPSRNSPARGDHPERPRRSGEAANTPAQ